MVKNPHANAGDMGSVPGSERSHGEGTWQPTPVLLPEKSYGQRSLAGYSPWDHRNVGPDLENKQQIMALFSGSCILYNSPVLFI